MASWSGFYKRPIAERQDEVRRAFPELAPDGAAWPLAGLDLALADNMIENCIGTMGLPFGLGLNLVLNGRSYVVPMVVEEPSVVAAVSNAFKTLAGSDGGGLTATHSERNVMIAQVQLLDIDDCSIAAQHILAAKDAILACANHFCASMARRGGGATGIEVRHIRPRVDASARRDYLVVHVLIDVCEAMGANVANTVAEGVAPMLQELTGGRAGLRILSNLAVHRLARASFRIHVDKLEHKGTPGRDVARRIMDAYYFAEDDPFRAVTNNKGIMNGIDAVALATGQDWRAIQAAAHAYVAVRESAYGSMSKYWLEDDGAYLCGQLELPIAIGTKGGALHSNPTYKFALGLLGNPDSKTLAMVMVAVGLAQNFAAIRALSTEGIQRGHMALHARNIAIAAGAPPELVAQVQAHLVASKNVSVTEAEAFLRTLGITPSQSN